MAWKRMAAMVSLGILVLGAGGTLADPGKITVDGSTPGAKIGPLFYGLMTEEINHSYDGGLYAELIQNRIFQDGKEPLHWSVIKSDAVDAAIALDETAPVNQTALTRSLRLDATTVPTNGRAGIANDGFYGIPVWPNTTYTATFYARASTAMPLSLDIESADGVTTFATASVKSVGTEWKKYSVTLSTADVPMSNRNRFVISTGQPGSVWFSLVSLFPPTYHDRPNGNRIDLMQKLADLHPSFLRFPGGNYLEGDTVETRFQWKKAIGPLEDRPGHMGCWSYRSSDGLGLLEFLDWCEDLKMEPLLAVYAGYSLRGMHVNPGQDLEPFVQEALEEIEYCTGDTSTPWGARRAKDGHLKPFNIHYIEIGNEDWFDRSGSYDSRFAQLFDAIKNRYPNLLCIATAPVHTRRPDLYDDHDYPNVRAMERQTTRYDHPDPNRPKVFFGEWATQNGKPTPTMRAAIADAAWLTGLQRDSETVQLNCYAPLLVNVNPGAWQWPTNLIGYDSTTSFGSPSYYAQCLFSRNWGTVNLPVTVTPQKIVEETPAPTPTGAIGVGTWHTAAEYKDIKVIAGGQTLFAADLSTNGKPAGWQSAAGRWAVKNGTLVQTETNHDDWITTGDASWQDYTLTLKARKTAGNEGFLILFHVKDGQTFDWFNVGGWGDTQTGVEATVENGRSQLGEPNPFRVQTGKWYDIRVEVRGTDIKCFVDDKLIVTCQDIAAPPPAQLFAAASRDEPTGDIIVKLVNPMHTAQQLQINLQHLPAVAADATVETVAGDPKSQNTVQDPMKTAVKSDAIHNAGNNFVYEFPADSVSVVRLKAK